MDKILFQKITITQIQYINVHQILVVTFEFTGAARGFMIMSGAARGGKKVGQNCSTQSYMPRPLAYSYLLAPLPLSPPPISESPSTPLLCHPSSPQFRSPSYTLPF